MKTNSNLQNAALILLVVFLAACSGKKAQSTTAINSQNSSNKNVKADNKDSIKDVLKANSKKTNGDDDLESQIEDVETNLNDKLEKLDEQPATNGENGDKEEIKTTEIPMDVNQRVKLWVNRFSTGFKDKFEEYLVRGKKYKKMMYNIFEQNGVPKELYYLSLIESGFNNSATSRVKAVGLWQFMPASGIQYGLKINRWVDERRDPEKSTEAGVRYLKDLHNIFGSWYLAMSSYNAGPYRVIGSILRGKTRDFWMLAEQNMLPKETMDYVPKFIAAYMIDNNPKDYGIDVDTTAEEIEYELVEIPGPVHLATIAQLTNTTTEHLRELNPELKTEYTPRDQDSYEIKIPKGNLEKIKENRELIAKAVVAKIKGKGGAEYSEIAKEGTKIHTVKKGETLASIAAQYGLTVKKLKKLNGMKKGKIHSGQKLRVMAISGTKKTTPKAKKTNEKETEQVKDSKVKTSTTQTDESDSEEKLVTAKYYKVKGGDTLASIASKYGTTITKIRKMNGLSKKSKLLAGQRLRVK